MVDSVKQLITRYQSTLSSADLTKFKSMTEAEQLKIAMVKIQDAKPTDMGALSNLESKADAAPVKNVFPANQPPKENSMGFTLERQSAPFVDDKTGKPTPEKELAQQPPAPKSEPKKTEYVIQLGDSVKSLVKKSLKAQGIENPDAKQLEDATKKFKEANTTVIHKKGYLIAGKKAILEGEVEIPKKTAKEVNDAWAAKHLKSSKANSSPKKEEEQAPPAASGKTPAAPKAGDPKAPVKTPVAQTPVTQTPVATPKAPPAAAGSTENPLAPPKADKNQTNYRTYFMDEAKKSGQDQSKADLDYDMEHVFTGELKKTVKKPQDGITLTEFYRTKDKKCAKKIWERPDKTRDVYEYTYDANGNEIKRTVNYSNKKIVTYDQNDNVLKEEIPTTPASEDTNKPKTGQESHKVAPQPKKAPTPSKPALPEQFDLTKSKDDKKVGFKLPTDKILENIKHNVDTPKKPAEKKPTPPASPKPALPDEFNLLKGKSEKKSEFKLPTDKILENLKHNVGKPKPAEKKPAPPASAPPELPDKFNLYKNKN